MTSVHLPFCFRYMYVDLLLCRDRHLCDLLCVVYALFRLISIASYVVKSPGIGLRGTKLEIFHEHISRKVDN